MPAETVVVNEAPTLSIGLLVATTVPEAFKREARMSRFVPTEIGLIVA